MEGQMRDITKNRNDVGISCWLPQRFIEGRRCRNVMRCGNPDMAVCGAVRAEIRYLEQKKVTVVAELNDKIRYLQGKRSRYFK